VSGSSGSGNSNLPDPYQKARRKRAASRQKRRFEAAFARIPIPRPRNLRVHMQGVTVPTVLLPTPWSLSKSISLLLLVGALLSLYFLQSQDDWYVYREDVRFHNLIRMKGDDLYQALHLDGLNIFWVEPDTIRKSLLAIPWVADAQVEVSLPANITVNVTEVTPAALWVTNAGNYWVSTTGSALPVADLEKSSLPDVALPQIVDSLQEARVVGNGPLALDSQVLKSAITLMAAMPELKGAVRYNKAIGLNFPLPDPSVWVYWGDGFDMDAKLQNLAVARDLIRKSDKPAQIVDVRLIDQPYVR
jgi:cell division septal protein FtsQ